MMIPQKFVTSLPKTVLMTPDEFSEILENPRQRNTHRHAAKACRRHLKEGHPAHAKVNIAQLPCGTRYKLDAHTRAYLWTDGRLPAPVQLSADVWECKNIDEVEQLYLTFDNRDAAEQNNMLLFGSLRSLGLEISSGLLQNAGLYAALQHIFGVQVDVAIDTPEIIVPALTIIDNAGFSGHRINSGFLAAMIATVYRDAEAALEFWRKHINDEGVKNGRVWDGVYGLAVIQERTIRTGVGREIMREVMRRSLSCYTAFNNGKTLRQNASEIAVTRFIPEGRDY